jgi:AGZA family xanthine/uracil permease-like MFS transporter
MEWIERYFEFDKYGTNLRTEVLAGLTTFMTMAYIIFVNPSILSVAMGKEAVPSLVTATAVSAGVATLMMGLYAKKPFALAPGMGLNAYFTYGVCLGLGYPWQVALAAVFVEGLIFIFLSVTKVRTAVINAIPLSQKYAIGAGIGLFLTLIGLKEAGIVTASVTNPNATVPGLLHPADWLPTLNTAFFKLPQFWLAVFGVFLASALMVRRIPGALLISILTVTGISIAMGLSPPPESIVSLPTLDYTFMKLDLTGLLNVGAIGVIFAFFMVDFFDTLGTVAGLSAKAGFIDEKGNIPDSEKILLTDAVGTTFGSILGTSTVTTYIESAAGIEEGGRTGFVAVVVGLLFLAVGLFVSPVAKIIPSFATAPALIVVGFLMLNVLSNLDFSDYTEALPAFFVLATIPFTYSIADGIGVGFISYCVLKLVAGRAKEVHPLLWILAGVFVVYFLYLGGLI